MNYKILGIEKKENTFEVDVEYGKNKKVRFSFENTSWKNEVWKKTIENRLSNLEEAEKIKIDKNKYIGKTFKTKESSNVVPSAEEKI